MNRLLIAVGVGAVLGSAVTLLLVDAFTPHPEPSLTIVVPEPLSEQLTVEILDVWGEQRADDVDEALQSDDPEQRAADLLNQRYQP
ncbi:MAG: hypothetical protein AAFV53_23265 [Myxococcota bacterium]